MLIEDFIWASNQTRSLKELFAVYGRAMSEHGFDRIIFSLITEHPDIHEEAKLGYIKSYPEHWFQYYMQHGYAEIDPVITLGVHYQRPFTWDEIGARSEVTKPQRRILDEGRESGLVDGISIPLRSRFQAIAGIGAASSTGGVNLDQHTLSIANVLSYQFYTRFLALASKKEKVAAIEFSDREIEVLKWIAKGCTKAQTAEKMNLSRHAIDYHVRNILLKTNSPNLTAAVVKAIHQNVIYL